MGLAVGRDVQGADQRAGVEDDFVLFACQEVVPVFEGLPPEHALQGQMEALVVSVQAEPESVAGRGLHLLELLPQLRLGQLLRQLREGEAHGAQAGNVPQQLEVRVPVDPVLDDRQLQATVFRVGNQKQLFLLPGKLQKGDLPGDQGDDPRRKALGEREAVPVPVGGHGREGVVPGELLYRKAFEVPFAEVLASEDVLLFGLELLEGVVGVLPRDEEVAVRVREDEGFVVLEALGQRQLRVQGRAAHRGNVAHPPLVAEREFEVPEVHQTVESLLDRFILGTGE